MNEDMNDRGTMDTQEFAECLDRWGSNLAGWPAPQRAAGNELLNASVRARELLDEANALERWLASAGDHQAPVALKARIIEQLPPQDVWQRALDWLFTAMWRPAAAATCMLLFGFLVGIAVPESEDDAMLDDVSMLAFSSTYQEFDDGSQWQQDAQ